MDQATTNVHALAESGKYTEALAAIVEAIALKDASILKSVASFKWSAQDKLNAYNELDVATVSARLGSNLVDVEGEPTTELAFLSQLLTIRSDDLNETMLNQIGKYALFAGDLDVATVAYGICYRSFQSATAAKELGTLYYTLYDPANAVRFWQKAAQHDKTIIDEIHTAARICLAQNKLTRAASLFEAVKNRDTENNYGCNGPSALLDYLLNPTAENAARRKNPKLSAEASSRISTVYDRYHNVFPEPNNSNARRELQDCWESVEPETQQFVIKSAMTIETPTELYLVHETYKIMKNRPEVQMVVDTYDEMAPLRAILQAPLRQGLHYSVWTFGNDMTPQPTFLPSAETTAMHDQIVLLAANMGETDGLALSDLFWKGAMELIHNYQVTQANVEHLVALMSDASLMAKAPNTMPLSTFIVHTQTVVAYMLAALVVRDMNAAVFPNQVAFRAAVVPHEAFMALVNIGLGLNDWTVCAAYSALSELAGHLEIPAFTSLIHNVVGSQILDTRLLHATRTDVLKVICVTDSLMMHIFFNPATPYSIRVGVLGSYLSTLLSFDESSGVYDDNCKIQEYFTGETEEFYWSKVQALAMRKAFMDDEMEVSDEEVD